MLGKIIGLTISAVFIGALAGTAVTAIMNVDTSTWGAAAPLWVVCGIAVVASFIVLVLKEVGVDF